jgi:hypothetical protein
MTDINRDTSDLALEATVVEYAASLPSRMLLTEFVDTVDRALRVNNSGTFKIAAIFMDELERRGYGDPKFRPSAI